MLLPMRIELLGLPLDLITLEQTLELLGKWVLDPTARKTVVTNNPECIVQCQKDDAFTTDIQKADLITADGIGMVIAGKKFGHTVPRATGVDIAKGLMQQQGPSLRVFFLGAKPGVAERAAKASAALYGIQIAGVQDGYFTKDQETQIAKRILEADTHLLLTGLGAAKQERFNEHRVARVAVGCGGTIDVLAGEAPLAPNWIRSIGFEWLWRIVKFKRWTRGLRLLEFLGLVLTRAK
jgi:N-acetylglucosaminyldiphosphoundecaprenol N-acetyl-beta-D-mannosaminyltransferase